MTLGGDPPPLGVQETQRLLQRLGDLADQLVLIGGQAVNFWAEYYLAQSRAPELLDHAPYTSKDIDFCARKDAVREFARRLAALNGRAFFPKPDDHTPNAGQVRFVDEQGHPREVDFLNNPFGLNAEDVLEQSTRMEVLSEDGADTGIAFRVMNPVHCLESRVHNVVGLSGAYNTDHGRSQLRASIVCAREFLKDLLDLPETEEYKPARKVLKLNKRILALCTETMAGIYVFARTGIEPFEAVLVDDRLGEQFISKGYPQMKAALAKVRRKAKEAEERTAQLRKQR